MERSLDTADLGFHAAAMASQPVSTGVIFDFKRYSLHDGPGIRTTVFLKGCPLSCWWCHNPESRSPQTFVQYTKDRCIGCGTCVDSCSEGALQLTSEGVVTDPQLCRNCGRCAEVCPALAREAIGRTLTVEEVMTEVEKDRPFYEQSGGGVTFSGGEPLAQPQFLLELLRGCGDRGLHRAVDTSGAAREEVLLEIAEETDLFLYDLKVMDAERHREATGISNRLVLSNLRVIAATETEIRVRLPLVPGLNDDDDNLDLTARFVLSLGAVSQVSVLPFHDLAESKHRKFEMPWHPDGLLSVTPRPIEEIVARLESFGLTVRVGG